MLFTDWVEREGRGTMQRIAKADLQWFKGQVPKSPRARQALRDSLRVSYKTVHKAGAHAVGVKDYDTAEKLSKLTGGECSVDELRHPRSHMTAARQLAFAALDAQREFEREAKRKRAA